MRRSLVLRRRLAYVRSRLVLVHRRLACVRGRLVLVHWRLAYVRSRLVLVRRRLAYVRSRLVLVRRRTRRVVIVRRCARCAGAMRSRRLGSCEPRSGSVIRVRDVVGSVRVRCSSTIGIGSVCTFGRASDIVVGRSRRLCVARIVCSWSIHRRIVRHRRITRPDHAGAVEGRWFGSCGHLRPALVHRRPLGAVGARHLLMPGLHRRGSDVAPAQGGFLSSIGARVDSAIATVIGDAIHGDIVHYGPVVNIVNVGYVHAIYVLVVIEITTAPVSAVVAITGITEAVVDAAIEAYRSGPSIRHARGRPNRPIPNSPASTESRLGGPAPTFRAPRNSHHHHTPSSLESRCSRDPGTKAARTPAAEAVRSPPR